MIFKIKPNYTTSLIFKEIFKAVLFWALFLLLLFISSSSLNSFLPEKWNSVSLGICGVITAMVTVWLFFLYFEKKKFSDYNLLPGSSSIVGFFHGILFGTLIFSILIILLLFFTELNLMHDDMGNKESYFFYLVFIPLALMEEIAFRSYPFIRLKNVLGLRITQVIIAIAFALYHIVLGWDPKIAFSGPAVWSFVFCLSAAWSGGIAVPTGIHVALNVMQGLFGLKPVYGSFWKLEYPAGISVDAINNGESIQTFMQLFVLLAAVILTEYFIRRRQKKWFAFNEPFRYILSETILTSSAMR